MFSEKLQLFKKLLYKIIIESLNNLQKTFSILKTF